MTYSDVIARGSGIVELFVRVDGWPVIMGTADAAPTDSWYTAGGWTYHRGLRTAGLRLGCEARPGEVWPDVSGCDIEVDDPSATLAGLLKSAESLSMAELAATITATDTTITVDTTTDLAASGVVHLGQEAVAYTGKTADTITGCTRGYYGSLAQEHIRDVDAIPAVIPELYDGPADMRGRRVVIYAAELVNGVVSTTEQIWVGYVAGYVDWIGGRIRIPIDHALKAFANGTVFGWAPRGRLRGLYVPNFDGHRFGRMELQPETTAGGGRVVIDVVTDGTAAFFEDTDEIWRAWFDQIATLTDWEAGRTPGGQPWIYYTGSAVSGGMISSKGTLSEILGFCDYSYSGGFIDVRDEMFYAPFAPASIFVETSPSSALWYERRLYLRSGEAQWFREAHCRIQWDGDGPQCGAKVLDVNTTDDYLVVQNSSTFGDAVWPDSHVVRGRSAGSEVSQIWGLDEYRLDEAVRVLWAGQPYAGSASFSYTVPMRWLAGPHLRDGDVDWARLTELVGALPSTLATISFPIEEPTKIAEILTGQLLAAGIYAYVKNNGTVGWARAELPALTQADENVSATMIDAQRSVEIETMIGRDQLLNVVHLVVKSWQEAPRDIHIVDQRSLQRYGAVTARDPSDPLSRITSSATEITIRVAPHQLHALPDHIDEIARHMAAGTMRLLATPRAGTRLPVTPVARSLTIGDAVLLSTGWVYDPAAGVEGVSSKLCLVVGFDRDYGLAGTGTDYLTLLIIDDPPGAIAPAALADGWDSGTSTLSFSNTDLYHSAADTTDLDHFAPGDVLHIYTHDSESPSSWTMTVSTVDPAAGEMVLTSSTAMPAGVVVSFAAYGICDASQIAAGWIWLADDADGLVDDARIAYRWG